MGIKARRKDANQCFDAWDRDRSGTLEITDLQGMCRQSLALPTKWRADPITLAELRPASAISRAASEAAAQRWDKFAVLQQSAPVQLQARAASC